MAGVLQSRFVVIGGEKSNPMDLENIPAGVSSGVIAVKRAFKGKTFIFQEERKLSGLHSCL